MDLIVEMRFGAHLYGTATPHSDLDLKDQRQALMCINRIYAYGRST